MHYCELLKSAVNSIQVTVNDIHKNGAIIEGVGIVVNLLARYEIVENIYLQTASRATALLSDAIVKLYTAILEYLLQAHAYFQSHLVKKIAKSIFEPEESTNKFISGISQKELEVEKCMRLISDETSGKIDKNMDSLTHSMGTFQTSMQTLQQDMAKIKLTGDDLGNTLGKLHKSTQQIHDDVSYVKVSGDNLKNQLIKALKDLEDPVQRIATQISDIQDDLKEKERLKVFEWLTMVPTSAHHRDKLRGLLPGSCNWLLRRKEFEEWMKASTSSILWLHGIPGSGKSMLVCHVIEYLRNRAQQCHDSAPIAYFYCARNVNEPERADPTELLRNILEQLCSIDAETPIRKPVSDAYLARKKEARGRKPEKLNLEDTIDVILELLETNPATIVIDGLDECNPTKRNDLLLGLQKIITMSNNVVKIFVSSRDDHDLVHHLAHSPNLYIHAADNTEDIMMFVESRVHEAIRDGKLLCGRVSDHLKNIIVQRLIEKAKGMFRLVSLHIDSLCDPYRIKTEANIHHALAHLPEELGKSYDVIISYIMQAEDPNPLLASRMLKWLLCSRETLDAQSISQALCVDISGYSLLSKDEILSICCNLVVYNKETKGFQFAHLSVREYLETQAEYSIEQANGMAAEACLNCIISDKQQQPEFKRHAEQYWGDYTKLATRNGGESDLDELLVTFLVSPFPSNPRGISRLYNYLERYEPSLCPLWTRDFNIQLLIWSLFLACKHDLSKIVDLLVSQTSTKYVFTEKSRAGLNCAQTSAWFDSPMTIDLLYDLTSTLLPKGLRFHTYWNSVDYVASHKKNWCVVRTISQRRIEENKLCTQGCDKHITSHHTNLLEAPRPSNNQGLGVAWPILLSQSKDSISSASTINEWFGLCGDCTYYTLTPLNMVELNFASAYHYLETITPETPLMNTIKDRAMFLITQNDSNSWMASISAMIFEHEVYDMVVFRHYITEALSYIYMHKWGTMGYTNMVNTEYSLTDWQYRMPFNKIRARRFLYEQKVIDRKALFLARDLDGGRDALLTLLQSHMKIAPEVIPLALSTWDIELVKALLEYYSIKISSEVIRFVAGNLKHGEEIMQLLLESEGPDTQCNDQKEHYSSNTLPNSQDIADHSEISIEGLELQLLSINEGTRELTPPSLRDLPMSN